MIMQWSYNFVSRKNETICICLAVGHFCRIVFYWMLVFTGALSPALGMHPSMAPHLQQLQAHLLRSAGGLLPLPPTPQGHPAMYSLVHHPLHASHSITKTEVSSLLTIMWLYSWHSNNVLKLPNRYEMFLLNFIPGRLKKAVLKCKKFFIICSNYYIM